ncbi:phenylacetate--CoA ligase PaaK [Burkholderia stabilis]|uniref:phenylacetate--CoA ligase PaaK n=1 Tax=Burkholderia stabilis TaxID=95485 RepID=UPI001F4AD515|nr:phenylacetate--CoA ligase PaaK [Burkholderia stabilis]
MVQRVPRVFELEPIERASRDELEALQLQRLKWTLRHAYQHVDHYRRAFDASGVHPDDLRELADLSKFPTTSKSDLRDNYPFGLFAVPRDELVRVHASSGTTGKPTVVGYTGRDIDTWADIVARSIRAAGGRREDTLHNAFGYGLFTGGLGIHYGAERLGCLVVPMSGGQTEKQIQLIMDFSPTIILATPSYMLSIIDGMERQGLDPTQTSLKLGIFGAEPWTEAMRGEIEARLRIDAVDIYGLSEVMGPGVACECVESKDGPVIWEDHFYPEIIDPVTGKVLPDGSQGELVFTSLTKEAMPIIRYRTRDLTSLRPPTSRSMRRLAKITGRSDDMLIIRGVNVFPTQIEEIILGIPNLSAQYQLTVSKEGHMDALSVAVEARSEICTSLAEIDRMVLARELQKRIKDNVGVSTMVAVVPTGHIPVSATGKAKRVIDSRALAG